MAISINVYRGGAASYSSPGGCAPRPLPQGKCLGGASHAQAMSHLSCAQLSLRRKRGMHHTHLSPLVKTNKPLHSFATLSLRCQRVQCARSPQAVSSSNRIRSPLNISSSTCDYKVLPHLRCIGQGLRLIPYALMCYILILIYPCFYIYPYKGYFFVS